MGGVWRWEVDIKFPSYFLRHGFSLYPEFSVLGRLAGQSLCPPHMIYPSLHACTKVTDRHCHCQFHIWVLEIQTRFLMQQELDPLNHFPSLTFFFLIQGNWSTDPEQARLELYILVTCPAPSTSWLMPAWYFVVYLCHGMFNQFSFCDV